MDNSEVVPKTAEVSVGLSEIVANTTEISPVALTSVLLGCPAKLRELQLDLDISDGFCMLDITISECVLVLGMKLPDGVLVLGTKISDNILMTLNSSRVTLTNLVSRQRKFR